jgi:hypothetical protein
MKHKILFSSVLISTVILGLSSQVSANNPSPLVDNQLLGDPILHIAAKKSSKKGSKKGSTKGSTKGNDCQSGGKGSTKGSTKGTTGKGTRCNPSLA